MASKLLQEHEWESHYFELDRKVFKFDFESVISVNLWHLIAKIVTSKYLTELKGKISDKAMSIPFYLRGRKLKFDQTSFSDSLNILIVQLLMI